MKKYSQLSLLALTFVGMTSCGGWSEKGEQQFHEACDKMKIERGQCDCMMDKAKSQFSSFDEMKNDQKAMAEIILSEECITAGEIKTK
jgi:hypothetical protein